MKNDTKLERIYDLLEQSDFIELSKEDKILVLEVMSIEAYMEQRSVICSTKDLFQEQIETKEEKPSKIISLFTYRVEFYKIAVVLVLFMAIGFGLLKLQVKSQPEMLALADTVFIEKTDTVVLEKTDTVEVVKEKIVYKNRIESNKRWMAKTEDMISAGYEKDCSKDICPQDLEKFSKINRRGNLSSDKILTSLVGLLE